MVFFLASAITRATDNPFVEFHFSSFAAAGDIGVRVEASVSVTIGCAQFVGLKYVCVDK